MERIIVELELLYRTQPGQWLPVHVRARPPERFPRARAFRRVPPSDLLVSRPLSLARVSFRTRPRVVSTASLTPPPSPPPLPRHPPLSVTSAQGIANMLANELGYEDEEEFEDALKGPFKDFISALPHVETANLESELQPGLFRDVFRIIPDPPAEECRPQRLVLEIKSRADLWRVLMLHPGAYVEIPELEFEIGADHRRRVDSVYNHVAASIFNLERHVEMLGEDDETAASERQGIKDACEKLRQVLDLDAKATFVVIDPGGLSAFKPSEGVEVKMLESDGGDYDRAMRAIAVPEDEREMEKVD